MSKPNPLYAFLHTQNFLNFLLKSDRFSANYYFHELPLSENPTTFQINDHAERVVSHHLSVYENIEEDTGFGSEYHYSICLEKRTIHVYFDEQDGVLKSTVRKDGHATDKKLSDVISAEEQILVDELIENYALPTVNKLRSQQRTLIKRLKQDYQELLHLINEQIYTASEQISDNLILIQRAISLGEEILRLSNKPGAIRGSTHSLRRMADRLQKLLKKPALEDIVSSEVSKRTETSLEHSSETDLAEQLPSAMPENKSLRIEKQPAQDSVTDKFQQAYAFAKQKWVELNGVTDIEQKIAIFLNFNEYLRELLIASNLLLSSAKDKKTDHRILCNAELGLACMQADYQQLGAELLNRCFEEPELFERHALSLALYTPMQSVTIIQDLIQRDDANALAFFLKHGKVSMNACLSHDDETTRLTLLTSAFRSQSLKCFILLLQQNANSAVLLNGLPLAHILLELPFDDPFYNAFLQHCRAYA